MKNKRKFKTKNILILVSFIFIVTISIFLFKNMNDNNLNKEKTSKQEKTVKKEEKKEPIGKIPTITLNGPSEVKIVKNGIFDDLGATANDEEDGDISENIKIDNKVDFTKPGEYEITYTVVDKDKNEVSEKRKIIVFEVTEKNTSGIAVLMYHYFYDDTAGEIGENNNFMAKSLFDEQLNYLSSNDYYFPTMKEISLYLDGKLDLPEKSVVITMDDGWSDNYTIAYPTAVKYKVPIVMFVVTSWTDVNLPYQKSMTNSGYVRFHSHTDDMHDAGCPEQHGAKILCIDYEAGVNDLKLSAEKIGNADALAYPCGDTNERAQNILRDAGYTLAFTTEYGKIQVGDNKLALPRIRMNDGISLESFINSL